MYRTCTSFIPGSILLMTAHVAGVHATRTKVCPKEWLFEGKWTELRHAGMSTAAHETSRGVRWWRRGHGRKQEGGMGVEGGVDWQGPVLPTLPISRGRPEVQEF